MSKDGGPAFPMKAEERKEMGGDIVLVTPGDYPGMSLRDYFAAKALQGISACAVDGVSEPCDDNQKQREYRSSVAATAYQLADAMLAERAK